MNSLIPPLPNLPEFTIYSNEHGSDPLETWTHVLNNFHLRFPCGKHTKGETHYPESPGYYRILSKDNEDWDEVNSTIYGNNGSRYSDKFLRMTQREYFAALDDAARKCSFDEKTLQDAGISRAQFSKDETSWIEVYARMYVELRRQGFTHGDLTP